METWLISGKLTILAYCVLKFALDNTGNVSWFVLAVLLYTCINTAFYIWRRDKAGKIPLILSMLLLIGCFRYLNGLFILLLPFNIYELAGFYSTSLWLPAAATVFPLPLLHMGERAEYLLVSAFSCMIYTLSFKSCGRIQLLAKENDRLRERVFALAGRLDRDAEYRRQMKYSSQLEERNKIAQEIHDRVGHAIAGSLMQLEAARLLLDKDRGKSGEIIQNVITILRDGMESIRVTLRNIKPAAGQLGVNRLKLLLDEFSANNHIKAAFVHKGDLDRISPVQWKVIRDNVGEALTNTLKYAGATSVAVSIEVLPKLVKAEVKDNGTGALAVKKGLGIRGMEERSGSLGGKVVIDGSKGFSVITLLPLEEGNFGDQTADR
ncbi:MAG: sensor histidine kinase [Peptococcaceae bacterium]|nr:sensor histidine kinase [Peptococcaceae bacterium]